MIPMAIIRVKEMAGKLRDVREELFSERGTVAAGGRPKNAGRIRELRRTVARLLTVAHQRKVDLEKEVVALLPAAPAKKEAPKKERKAKAPKEAKAPAKKEHVPADTKPAKEAGKKAAVKPSPANEAGAQESAHKATGAKK